MENTNQFLNMILFRKPVDSNSNNQTIHDTIPNIINKNDSKNCKDDPEDKKGSKIDENKNIILNTRSNFSKMVNSNKDDKKDKVNDNFNLNTTTIENGDDLLKDDVISNNEADKGNNFVRVGSFKRRITSSIITITDIVKTKTTDIYTNYIQPVIAQGLNINAQNHNHRCEKSPECSTNNVTENYSNKLRHLQIQKFLKENITLKEKASVHSPENENYGHAEMQGHRHSMEDAYSVLYFEGFKAYAIMDGHGHKCTADFAAKFLSLILKDFVIEELKTIDRKQLNITNLIKQTFLEMDNRLYNELLDPDLINSGCTVVMCIIDEIKDCFYLVNLGDSRGIVVRDNVVLEATEDHKPFSKKETERIEQAGGVVVNRRVMGQLAVSRALGDFNLKDKPFKGINLDSKRAIRYSENPRPLVIAEPDITCHSIQEYNSPASSKLSVLLACDGVFDVLDNNRLASIIHNELIKHDSMENVGDNVLNLPYLGDIAKSIIFTAIDNFSGDNISALIIRVN